MEMFRKADFAVKFYVFTLTTMAGWLASGKVEGVVAAALLVTLGIIGAGHVAHYHVRAARLHRKARMLADSLARSAQVPEDLRLYDASDDQISLLAAGQAITGAVFNSAIVLLLGCIYSTVLVMLHPPV